MAANRMAIEVDADRQVAVAVVILAAGVGKRMQSTLPKILHALAGQPMICHLLQSWSLYGSYRIRDPTVVYLSRLYEGILTKRGQLYLEDIRVNTTQAPGSRSPWIRQPQVDNNPRLRKMGGSTAKS